MILFLINLKMRMAKYQSSLAALLIEFEGTPRTWLAKFGQLKLSRFQLVSLIRSSRQIICLLTKLQLSLAIESQPKQNWDLSKRDARVNDLICTKSTERPNRSKLQKIGPLSIWVIWTTKRTGMPFFVLKSRSFRRCWRSMSWCSTSWRYI